MSDSQLRCRKHSSLATTQGEASAAVTASASNGSVAKGHKQKPSTTQSMHSPLCSSLEDFVNADVSEALEEAREIATKGRARDHPHERLRADTTTVKVTKSGTRNEPMEVTVSRSRVLSNSDEGEDGRWEGVEDVDIGSYSDSEFPPRSLSLHKHSISAQVMSREGAGSEDELPFTDRHRASTQSHAPRHMSVRYRRKHDELWRKEETADGDAEADDELGGDEAQLEIDVKEEECTTDAGAHLVIKTWEARWTVQNFELLPEWLQDNEYLMTGHRPPLPSFAECFKSILSLHTETGNIWTHMIGCIAFFVLALWFLFFTDHPHIQLQEKLVFSFFFVGAIVCLGLSFTFHTVSCHSFSIQRAFSKLDYMGISLLIVGSFIPWIYYGFYCRREPKISYITMVIVLGIGAVIVSLWDKFGEKRFRPIRAGLFAGMGLSGVVPTVHFIVTDGIHRMIEENSFYWLLAMALLYLLGTLLYATRTPERFFPGYCDIWFQSHQLFHLCVVCAAFAHYYGISEMAMKRLTGASCDLSYPLGGGGGGGNTHEDL